MGWLMQFHGMICAVLFSGASGSRSSNPHSTSSVGPVDRAAARLDALNLGPVVWELFSAGLAPTRQNYRSGTRRHLKFCRTQQIEVPFPVSERTLCQLIAWLHTQHLASSTVKNYLAAVRHSQIALGLGDRKIGSMTQLEYVIRGMKRKTQTTRRMRLPISPVMLQGVRRIWQQHPNPRDAAMLCFFGFLRVGEIVSPSDRFDPACHPAQGDVRVNNNQDPQFVVVQIKASKTDPFRQGTSVYLGRLTTSFSQWRLFWVTWFSVAAAKAPSSPSRMGVT